MYDLVVYEGYNTLVLYALTSPERFSSEERLIPVPPEYGKAPVDTFR